ncbi:hypothetical protein F5877DRAFT_74576 [Lentinula edodes]|nr:hypothetical protein F5877DRAFT_74576 [Lentinula edodes]
MSRTHMLRKHVRSVVNEECENLYQLTDFKKALMCWRDMIICMSFCYFDQLMKLTIIPGLDLFRIAGFIHLDLSGGNTLFFEGKGIISDLEYAKRYNEVSSHDPKTSTPDFMAAEYQANFFFFLPSRTDATAELFKLQDEGLHPILYTMWNRFTGNIYGSSTTASLRLRRPRSQLWKKSNDKLDGILVILLGVLESVYCPLILQPLDLSITLREEYRRVVRSLPMKKSDDAWRLGDVFNGDIYEKFLGKLQAVLDAYPDGYITLDAAR